MISLDFLLKDILKKNCSCMEFRASAFQDLVLHAKYGSVVVRSLISDQILTI